MKGRCDDTSPLATLKCRAIHRVSPRDQLQFTPQPQFEHFRSILGLTGSLLVPPKVSRLLSVTARADDAPDAARGDAAMPQDALHVETMSVKERCCVRGLNWFVCREAHQLGTALGESLQPHTVP